MKRHTNPNDTKNRAIKYHPGAAAELAKMQQARSRKGGKSGGSAGERRERKTTKRGGREVKPEREAKRKTRCRM